MKTKATRWLQLFLAAVPQILPLPLHADQNLAGNVTVTGGTSAGNLFVTGNVDVDGTTIAVGSPSGGGTGASLLFDDNNNDTLTFSVNRNAGSWRWMHNTGVSAMRLSTLHELLLYQADGTTAGITLFPASSSLKLGTLATLTGDGSGVLTASGGLTVGGNFIASNGSFAGGTSGLNLAAGGSNQNITLTPSGSGYTRFYGNVGIGKAPAVALDVAGHARFTGGGTFGYTANLGSNSGIVLGAAPKASAPSGGLGQIQIFSNDAANQFQAWVALATDPTATNRRLTLGAIEQGVAWRNITLAEGGGYVGIGAAVPATKLHVFGGSIFNQTTSGQAYLFGGNQDGGVNGKYSAIGMASGGYITFSRVSDALVPTEYARFTDAGRLGIGTTAPQAGLDVHHGIHVHGAGSYATTGAGLEILKITDDLGTISMINAPDRSERELRFYGTPVSFYQAGLERMRVASSGNVGIGVAAPTQKLDVEGSIRAGGRTRVGLTRGIGGAVGDTVSVGSFSSDGVGKSMRVYLRGHNGGVIDVHTYDLSEIAYIGATTNWLEVPLSQHSSSYNGTPAYALDVYRPNIASPTDALFLRVRVKRNVSAGTVYLVVEYDGNSTLTPSTATSTTAIGFNATTAPAGGGLQGYLGAVEWSFPVSPAQGWDSSGSNGLFVRNSGNVGIGTTSPSHKLAVNGTIRAKEVIVDTGWADYVFADDYRLAPLSEVEEHIRDKKHLPGIPSAVEVEAHGVSMGEMQSKLLAKVEELTLHLIAQQKEISVLRAELAALKPAQAP